MCTHIHATDYFQDGRVVKSTYISEMGVDPKLQIVAALIKTISVSLATPSMQMNG